MKKYSIIFSIFLALILLCASCVSGADIDDSSPMAIENEEIELSQGDNIDLNYENEIFESNEIQANQDETNFNEDLQDGTANGLGSVDNELALNSSDDDSAGDDELVLNEPNDIYSVEDTSTNALGDDLPDVICEAEKLDGLQLYILFMETYDTPSGELLRQHLSTIYQSPIPKEHTNTLRLKYDVETISDKLIISMTQGKNVVIDGMGHTINLKGSSKHDHYFVVKSGHVTFQNINFTNGYNKDGDKGGAISFEDNAVGTIINCSFSNCYAEDDGGAVADRSGNTLTIINSTFNQNYAQKGDGGAVWSNGNLILTNCTFINNLATDEGLMSYGTPKGLAVCAKGSLTIDGGYFANHDDEWVQDGWVNEANAHGAVYANELRFTNATTTFWDNSAEKGGAIYAEKIIGNVTNVMFLGNYAEKTAGAIYVDDECNVNFIGCVFAYNNAYDDAGAVYFDDGDSFSSFTNCFFICNRHETTSGYGVTDTNVRTKGNLYVNQNFYFSNLEADDFEYKFFYKSNKKYVDPDPYYFHYYVTPNVDVFDLTITFETNSDNHTNSLLMDAVGIHAYGGDLIEISKGNNSIKATVVPKTDSLVEVIADISGKGKYFHDALFWAAGIYLYFQNEDPELSVEVNDVIGTEEDCALVELHLNETINRTVEVEYNNEIYTVDVVNGYGKVFIYHLSEGTNTVKAIFNKTVVFRDAECVATFEVKPKTTPDDVYEFTTLQNKVNHEESNLLILDNDYMYSSVNDITLKNGVLLSRDNFVIDGQGHTINGVGLARIFNVTGKNVTIKNINFINGNTLDAGGAIYFANVGAVEGSNFLENHALSGSAIYSLANLTIKDSVFLNNKGGYCHIDMYIDGSNVVIELLGSNSYINAISSFANILFENVSYWNGELVNTDLVPPEYASPGMNVTLEVYKYGTMELVKNLTFVTGNDGKCSYSTSDLDMWVYKFMAYHMDDDYYPYANRTEDIYLLDRNSSSVTIDLEDNSEFTYPDIPQIISFTVENRTGNVTVIITDHDGNVVLNQSTSENYVDIESLAFSTDYYNITVYNMANVEFEPSNDTKLFKLLKANSSIALNEIGPFTYKDSIRFDWSVENLTTVNLTIYDSDGNILYSKNDLTETTFYLPIELSAGQYNITVVNNANGTHMGSEDSKIFDVSKFKINATVTVDGNKTYGEETVLTFKYDMAGTYIIDLNGNNFTIKLEENAEVVLNMVLPAGSYEAILIYDDSNYENIGDKAVFEIYPLKNDISVIVIGNNNRTYGDKISLNVIADVNDTYVLDVNGRTETVEVNIKSGDKYFGLIDLEFLDVGNYEAKVICDNPNYNLSISDATFIVNKAKINNDITVDTGGLIGSAYMTITSDRLFGYYTINIDGKERSVSVADGIGHTYFDLPVGRTYTATIEFEDSNFELSKTEVTFDVPERFNHVIVSVANVTYPDSVVVIINAEVDGLYNLSIGDINKTVIVENGTGNATAFLDVGTYYANVTFESRYCQSDIQNAIFEVLKGTRNVTVSASNVKYGEKAVINVKSTVDGVYMINVSGDIQFVNVVEGEGNVSLSLNVGSYSVSVILDESPNFDDYVTNASFKVTKRNAAISASNKAYVINYGGNYQMVLKDANGKVLAGKKITFTLNGRNAGSAKTNSKGVATIKLNAKLLKAVKAGKRNLVIKFAGDSIYNAVSKTVKITVKKEKTKLIAKNKNFKRAVRIKKYKVTLKNSKGKVIKKVKLTLRVKGKTFSAKTNSKGQALFKITNLKKKGKFWTRIKFNGNAYYNPVSKKIRIVVK